MSGRPDVMVRRPADAEPQNVEHLAEVLRTVRVKSGIFLDARFTRPWAVSSVVTSNECKPVLQNPSQMIAFHFVTKGQMFVHVTGREPVRIGEGELVLLPRNDPHILASGENVPVVRGQSLVQIGPNGGLAIARHGGGGEETRMICGFLGNDGGYHPLIEGLPPVLNISLQQATSRGMIQASLEFGALQAAEGIDAHSPVIPRLSELLFVEAVRIHAEKNASEVESWVGVFRDPQIGRVLTELHTDLARPWTTGELAQLAGMSRSAFMERFTEVCGLPPIRYMTMWRMRSAERLLRDTSRTIAQIAAAVGYESESSFSKACKRAFGRSPSELRGTPASGTQPSDPSAGV